MKLLRTPSIGIGSRAVLLLNAAGATSKPQNCYFHRSSFSKALFKSQIWKFSTKSALDPPDVPHLAETARISLTPEEVEEFAPKIQQVIDWFGQLQAVDLQIVEPTIRADTEGDNLRGDIPTTFDNRDAMIASIPSYEERYIKVPKVLNKD